MARTLIRDLEKFTTDELIKTIAKENCISPATVRTVVTAIPNIILRELAKGKAVKINTVGYIRPAYKKAYAHWLPKDHPDYKIDSVNPHMQFGPTFRMKLQALMGYHIAINHQQAEKIAYYRNNPVGSLRLDKVQPPPPVQSAFEKE